MENTEKMFTDEDHIGLVYHIAQELAVNNETCIRAFGKDVAEYIGEGYLALQVAKRNFKPEYGFKFSTYASKVIRDRIIQAARRSSLIKIGFQARYQAMRSMQGREVKSGSEKKAADALKVMTAQLIPITPDNNNYFSCTDKPPEWEITEELLTRVDTLDERTKFVLMRRFGLDGEEPETLQEVGEKMDPPVTRERVRQIERNGLLKLKDLLQV